MNFAQRAGKDNASMHNIKKENLISNSFYLKDLYFMQKYSKKGDLINILVKRNKAYFSLL
tara:strand:- start:440 stop:619 length:180 start_codon:yes stop_codon:yes gene_type:complete